jgi:hypothetical protein
MRDTGETHFKKGGICRPAGAGINRLAEYYAYIVPKLRENLGRGANCRGNPGGAGENEDFGGDQAI